MRFLVKVEGKLIVAAPDKKTALARANVYMTRVGLSTFKGNEHYTEEIEEEQVVEAECKF